MIIQPSEESLWLLVLYFPLGYRGFFQKDLCRQNWSNHRLNYSSGLGIAASDAGEMCRKIPGRNKPYRCLKNELPCCGILFGNSGLKSRLENIVVTQCL